MKQNKLTNLKPTVFVILMLISTWFKLTTTLFAESQTITSKNDWISGVSDNVDAYSVSGTLQLKPDGTWGAISLKTPALALSRGTAVVSDGTSIFILANDYTDFLKYIPEENDYEYLERVPARPQYGADMTVMGDYIYTVFGGNQRDFARYSISQNTWEQLELLPDFPGYGANVVNDGTYIYAKRGNADRKSVV